MTGKEKTLIAVVEELRAEIAALRAERCHGCHRCNCWHTNVHYYPRTYGAAPYPYTVTYSTSNVIGGGGGGS